MAFALQAHMKAGVLAIAFAAFLLASPPARSADHGHDRPGFSGHVHHDFDHRRFRGRFGYPACFGYAYCPYYVPGCVWSEGYWIDEPYIGPDGIERYQPLWIPAGCY